VDYAAIHAQLYSRLATDAAGSAVRALLGSIFPAEELRNLTGKTLPYAAWRAGSVGGQSGGMRDVFGSWWVYVRPQDAPRKLHQIAGPLEALYGYTARMDDGSITATTGQPFLDEALTLAGIQITVIYRQRG